MANEETPQPAKAKPAIVESVDSNVKRVKTSEVPPAQRLMGLVSYFLALLLLALGGLVYLLLLANFSSTSLEIVRTLGFVAAGAMIGSVLYQIRRLFRRYYENQNHEQVWMGECLSAPWEAVGLATVVLSLIRGGAFLLGGYAASAPGPVNADTARAFGFVAFGAGALVGFGTREVVLWLRTLMKTMFPTPKPELVDTESANHILRRSKAS